MTTGSYYNNGGGPTSSGDGSVTIETGSTVSSQQYGPWSVTLLAGSTTAVTQSGVWSVSLVAGASVASAQSGAWTVSLTTNTDVNALPAAAVAGGAKPEAVISFASTNATLAKNAPGNLYGLTLANTNATTWRWLKLFDKATAPVPGADTPVAVIGLPPAGTVSRDFPVGLTFAQGLGFAITANPALLDNTAIAANEVVGTMEYA
jgi:hypothetical protein